MNPPIQNPGSPPTPFGPADASVLDLADIQQRAETTRQALLEAQTNLTRLRYGPGPDNQDPPLREVTRADGQWPFLLIRAFPGDVGQRPVPPEVPALQSPDIMVTAAGPATEPKIVDRSGILALKAREVVKPQGSMALDVWVHVWNLGHSQATGVRVRVRLFTLANPDFNGVFIGGTALDLGDRLSEQAHRAVKVVTFEAPYYFYSSNFTLMAVADCLSDPAASPILPGNDRHAAHRHFTSY